MPGAVKVADHSMQAFVACAIPLGDFTCEHADRVQEVKPTAPGKVKDLHENAGCRWRQGARALDILRGEGRIVDAGVITCFRELSGIGAASGYPLTHWSMKPAISYR